jgi:hypothetical protein
MSHQFLQGEMGVHQDEMDLIEGLSSIMHQLQDEAMIPLGGMVRPENYERLRSSTDDSCKTSLIWGIMLNKRPCMQNFGHILTTNTGVSSD